jgi:hypothetical protein
MDKWFMQKCGVLAAVALCMATHLRAEPRIDFNGDGYADLAVGVPDEDDAKATDAGAVNIIYGSASGLTEIGNAFITQRTKGVPGNRQKGAKFGKALGAGDFDGDGFTDLAVGAPFFDQPHLRDAGYVVIFDGADKGLSGSRANGLIWLDSMARNSNFGAALAAGDFDADGIDDIAVGAPEFWRDQEITPGSGHGAVLVWHGSRFGMDRMQLWRQGEDGLGETSEYRDLFGSASSQPISMRRSRDLAVGAPERRLPTTCRSARSACCLARPGQGSPRPATRSGPRSAMEEETRPRRGTDTGIAWEAGTSTATAAMSWWWGPWATTPCTSSTGRARG